MTAQQTGSKKYSAVAFPNSTTFIQANKETPMYDSTEFDVIMDRANAEYEEEVQEEYWTTVKYMVDNEGFDLEEALHVVAFDGWEQNPYFGIPSWAFKPGSTRLEDIDWSYFQDP